MIDTAGAAGAEEDLRIIALVREGKEGEFRHLVEKYQSYIYTLIMRQLGDPQTAEELSQDVFVKAHRAIGRFEKRSKFSTWLTRIALNTVYSYCRSGKYRASKLARSLSAEELQQIPAPGTVSGIIRDERVVCWLREAVAQLRPKYRDVIVLRYFEGKTYQETAEILGIAEGTISSRLNTAQKQLLQMYRRQK